MSLVLIVRSVSRDSCCDSIHTSSCAYYKANTNVISQIMQAAALVVMYAVTSGECYVYRLCSYVRIIQYTTFTPLIKVIYQCVFHIIVNSYIMSMSALPDIYT